MSQVVFYLPCKDTSHLEAFSTSVLYNPGSINLGTQEKNLEMLVNRFSWV